MQRVRSESCISLPRRSKLAVGFTGKLITQYLAGHKDSAAFTLALGARSKSRLDAVVSSLDLGTAVELHVVDTTRQEQLDALVKTATVVINTVGPFFLWGTPVVQSVSLPRCFACF